MASVPTTQRAALVPEAHGKNVVEDRPVPEIGADEVLIKITATAINPVDWKIRDYNIFVSSYPAVLGSDAAGTIAAVGANVTDFQTGERVFFQGKLGENDSCTFQQYAKMPAALVGKTPSKVSDDEAAGVSLTIVAAVTAFYDQSGQGIVPPWDENGSKVGAGKAAVILGGSSSVGQFAIQLAKLSGFERIVTNSSAAHIDHLKSLGATTVLDRSKSSAQDFKDAVGDHSVEFVLDGISAKATQTLAVQILQELNGGNVIILMTPDADAKKLGEESGKKSVTIKGVVGAGSNPKMRYLSEPLFKTLGGENGWLATGKIVPNRPEVVAGGLKSIEEALEKNKKGVSGVKVIIRPQDG